MAESMDFCSVELMVAQMVDEKAVLKAACWAVTTAALTASLRDEMMVEPKVCWKVARMAAWMVSLRAG